MTKTPVDQLIGHFDRVLRTTAGTLSATSRPLPGKDLPTMSLTDEERTESARLMRVNHCGEVCAQALYQGQALTSRSAHTRKAMEKAATEEEDHLYWCQERLKSLDSHVSYLNPLFYAASFATGAITGLMGDRINLGFVAATEAQVCRHLDEHIEKLPADDAQSREILEEMRRDEKHHENTAMELGGAHFPSPVQRVMTLMSRAMTRTTYWI